jgi:hypothetical protein
MFSSGVHGLSDQILSIWTDTMGRLRCSPWASCCWVWRIWHNTPVWASMNASTTVLGGGGGGRSLPLPDAPKPTGELHVGSTIWKNWASIKYIFISLLSQAEHVRRKTQLEPKVGLRQRNILELRMWCAQPKTTRIHDSNVHTNAKIWSNLISNLELKAKVITCGRIWYEGLILAVGEQKFPTQPPESQNFPNFYSNSVT